MKQLSILQFFFVILFLIPGHLAAQPPLELLEGFKATVFAKDLGPGRHLAVSDNGDVYLQLRQNTAEGSTVALRDTDRDGVADEVKYFGNLPGTGIEIYDGYLYTSTDTSIQRYRFRTGELLPDRKVDVVVRGFPDQSQHAAKPFTFDKDGNLYVTVGAPSNACMEEMRTKGSPGMDPCPLLESYGGIWCFDGVESGLSFSQDGERFATGIRHAVALNYNTREEQLYAVQHGRDQLSQFFPDLYSDKENAMLPAEEFFIIDEGDDFGWPYCYYDQRKGKKVLAPEYGGDKNKTGRCADKKDPLIGFPGHYAPNDILFYDKEQFPEKYRHGAFIAFHGSWNRAPLEQEGYNIVFVPFSGKTPSGKWSVFADGFAGVAEVKSPSDAEHRPTGVAVGPQGALYVVDSRKGTIWKIEYHE
jgi:glucose/arabinose dehydrogenase